MHVQVVTEHLTHIKVASLLGLQSTKKNDDCFITWWNINKMNGTITNACMFKTPTKSNSYCLSLTKVLIHAISPKAGGIENYCISVAKILIKR